MKRRLLPALAALGLTCCVAPLTGGDGAGAVEGDWHQYWTVGGVSECVEPGSADDTRYAADQERLFGHRNHRPCPNPATVPTTTTVPCRTFLLAGGNFCLPEGTPEYAVAVELEARYREWVDANLPPTSAPPPETTTTTQPAPASTDVVVTTDLPEAPAPPVAAPAPDPGALTLPETR